MAKKPVDLQALADELQRIGSEHSELTGEIAKLSHSGVPMPAELAERMQRALVLIARDATDAAAKLYATIRSAHMAAEHVATTVKP